jgi:hypothetical protein
MSKEFDVIPLLEPVSYGGRIDIPIGGQRRMFKRLLHSLMYPVVLTPLTALAIMNVNSYHVHGQWYNLVSGAFAATTLLVLIARYNQLGTVGGNKC